MLIAPRPVLFESAERDPCFPIAYARQGFARIQAGYRVFGARGKVRQDSWPAGHEWHGDVAYSFVDGVLGGNAEFCRDEGAMFQLYNDETIGPLLRSSRYADLHEKHPLEITRHMGESEMVMLLNKLPDWNISGLQKALAKLPKQARVTGLPQGEGTARQKFVIAIGSARVLISLHDRRYVNEQAMMRRGVSRQHQAMLKEQTAWVSIAGVRWSQPAGKANCDEIVRDVVLCLLDENCAAIWLAVGS